MKSLRSLWGAIFGIGIGIGVAIAVAIAIAIAFCGLAKPTATAIATPIPIPTFLAFCLHFWNSYLFRRESLGRFEKEP
jgi:hypothetical protein